ncbi:putative efflux protein, MATE family [Halopseudomonas sabulinigri]|uniref:Putative efflux protein, MATE family n=1 Tax=Halopseudomonas sabulinigri TaxID=472181 RepID=A0A1H1TEM1_9GAMM|nr:MATE family efflux transporter [Halopseudomonas sabulinigri]SDS58727.1 putative efflux protein, MATE family [Halopseudomonas sabulinigri]
MKSNTAAPSDTDNRTTRLLQAPILPLLLTMAWPNVLIMCAQASTGLIETWWVAKLGTDALAGMALVFPGVMLMQMMSAGAMGGGISSAVARALGAGRRGDANALVWHALLINGAIGLLFSLLFLLFGSPLYRFMGGDGAALAAALEYSNVVFAGTLALWLMNALASVIRGTGNMLFPALVTCAGVLLLIPLSPLLIFGFGPLPGLGVAGGGVAMVLFFVGGALAMLWFILSGRCVVRLSRTPVAWRYLRDILHIGLLSSITTVLTNIIIAGATALVALGAGMQAVAGFGTGVRLEYLLVPLAFGIGAPLVVLVGTNLGAGQQERALRIGLTGGLVAFVATEAIGLSAALWPEQWLRLFTHDPVALVTGADYLRIVGPTYGFFGLGLALYFASQGAGRLRWPLIAGLLRLAIALGGGWLALQLSDSVNAVFYALALAMLVYGLLIALAVWRRSWFSAAARPATPTISSPSPAPVER